MERYARVAHAPGCPSQEILIDFDLGRLSAADLDSVAAHLSSCGPCEQFLSSLHDRPAGDQVVGRLKQCLAQPPLPDEPACAAMEALAEAMYAATQPEQAGRGADPADPGRVGRYEVLGRIGQGGMGVVYRARQVPLDRTVALKMILAGHHAGAKAVTRFGREGKAVARLHHPNVVQVYEFGEHDGLPYYSMEWVDGGSLREALADGPLGPREAAELVRVLAVAVGYAHREGVIHRDLKPANVLLTRDGTPKVTDFGLAKLLDAGPDGPERALLTESDTILGTANYMAPEQAEGRADDISRTTDVYGLGAILYECLAGRPPFLGETRARTLDLVRSADPLPPSRRRPGLPPRLEAVCLKCLEKSPSRRYPTAEALADDLGRWLRDGRPRGVPGWPARLARVARRRAAVVLTLAASALVGGAFYLNRPDRAAERLQNELARGRAVTLIGETGGPRWSRWRAGEPASGWLLAGDHTMTVHSWDLGLLELLPDPGSDSYRITAQVRHDKGDLSGEVGLYFARTAYPRGPADLQAFFQVTFNAVRGDADRWAQFSEAGLPVRPPRSNAVQLLPRLFSDGEPHTRDDRIISGVTGPRFLPRGENNGRWDDLEVTVTPVAVTARWNGEPFSMDTSDIRQKIRTGLATYPLRPPNPFPRGFVPAFGTRGGIGLFVRRGSASFRAVTVAPFGNAQPTLTSIRQRTF